jgi:hypothetical protein
MRLALVSIVCFAVVAAAAVAGFTPAWSYVSPTLRSQLAAKTGGPLYLPARTPLFYRYRSGATVSRGTLTVPFTNRVRIRAGLWHWTKDTFMWRAQRLSGDCASWRPVDKTLQVGGY